MFLTTLVANTEIADALGRIENLMQEDAFLVAAQTLLAAHRVDDEMIPISSNVEGIVGRVSFLEGAMVMRSFRDILDSAPP
jgi:hypothetical protein